MGEELGLHFVVTIRQDPTVGLTAARVLMTLIDELQAGSVPVCRVELSIEGPFPGSQRTA
jgi:hypothetical protein